MADNERQQGQGTKQGGQGPGAQPQKQGSESEQFQNDRDANRQGEMTRGQEDRKREGEKSGESPQRGGNPGQSNRT